ncbi:MAG: endonuclease MutS2 [bacterium]|nr:endonuclease MutS2 [bacterium]
MNEHTEAVLDYACIKRALQAYTVTPMGGASAADLKPSSALDLLDVQLRETSEMAACLAVDEGPPLLPLPDLYPHLASTRIEGFYLEGWQLLEIASGLEVIQRLRHYPQTVTQPILLLRRRLTRLHDFAILLRQIRHAIDDKGLVRDHASPALQDIRQKLSRLRERIHAKLHELMTVHRSVVQDTIVTIRNNRFVVPLKTEFRQSMRGIVHGESASGATVYVEPEGVVDLNNQLLHARAEEERAEREVLRQLTGRIAVQHVALEQSLRIVGQLDFICAKGRLSLSMQGKQPRLTTQPHLQLIAARHPLLTDPTPIDVQLGSENQTLLITGPNTGGKTAVLKTVGLLALMAQSGLHIPAASDSQLPVFSEIFVDLGDEQSLQQNLSTFSAHLANICDMLTHVTGHSLVLLDELGAGTDPMEGGPLGVAILEQFHQCGGMTLATTHHSGIKTFAMSMSGVACAAVDFDLETLQPRYRLVYGLPGRSKAFAIAEKLGLPAAVLARARQEAGMTQQRSEQFLARLEVQQQALSEERQHVQVKQDETNQLHIDARQMYACARAEELRVRQTLYAEGQALLKTARQELDTTIAALRRQAVSTTPIAFPREAWRRMEQAVVSLAPQVLDEPVAVQRLQIGEKVRVRGLRLVGHLRTAINGTAAVQIEVGNKILTVSPADLERIDGAADASSAAAAVALHQPILPRQEAVAPELRLLGYTVAQAIPELEKYLDHAFMQGASRVRIIHGVGSGRLRKAITNLLAEHPLVHRFEGGGARGGMTVVELER